MEVVARDRNCDYGGRGDLGWQQLRKECDFKGLFFDVLNFTD
jgi:hypothetical protein